MNFDPRIIRLIMDLRTGGVSDTEVLSAIERIPRDLFVDEQFRERAYENSALPIGLGQTISQPSIVALMIEALEVDSKMKVLEIGTGSGYQTAILSLLCRRVYTIEMHRPLLERAQECFKYLNLTNIVTKYGDGYKGWVEQKPFDRIIVSAAAEKMPEKLIEQLGEGGIMIIPIGGQAQDQYVIKVKKTKDSYTEERLWPVRFVPFVANDSKKPKKPAAS